MQKWRNDSLDSGQGFSMYVYRGSGEKDYRKMNKVIAASIISRGDGHCGTAQVLDFLFVSN